MAVQEQEWEELLAAARQAARHAYAPYSGFPVGAALLAGGGRVYAGCNVENGSFPLGLCAERAALAAAVAAGVREFTALALSVPGPGISTPCGACRQVLHEFAPHLSILVEAREGGRRRHFELADLLPEPFILRTE